MRTGFHQITAVILAGGKGERLKSVLQDRPKVLAEISGKPLLAYLLDRLRLFGFQRVVLATGVGADQVQGVFGMQYQNLELIYSREEKPLGTAGALRLALDVCKEKILLVMNGDSFCDVDLEDFLTWFLKGNYEMGMVLAPSCKDKRFGVVKIEADGRVKSFQEKAQAEGYVNAGIYFVKRSLVETIPSHREVSLEKEMFPIWTSRAFYGYPTEAVLRDIGTPESYAECQKGTVPLFEKGLSLRGLSPCL